MEKLEIVKHEFKPIYQKDSRILLLGSIPSIKSREVGFYYGNPNNRFWQVLEIIYQEKIIDKVAFLNKHHIALWDVCASCKISSSSDASIKNVTPNNLEIIINNSSIQAIFLNGQTAFKYYQKFFANKFLIPYFLLPSTSPANCRYKLNDLVTFYQKIKEYTS